MIFESTPPRGNGLTGFDTSPVGSQQQRRGLPTPARATATSPVTSSMSPGAAASPGDDGSPYETNSIKFADYFQQQDVPQSNALLLRQSSSVVFDSHGSRVSQRQGAATSAAAFDVTLSSSFEHEQNAQRYQAAAESNDERSSGGRGAVLPPAVVPTIGGTSFAADASRNNNSSFIASPRGVPTLSQMQRSTATNASFASSSPLRQLTQQQDSASFTPQQSAQRDALRQIASELKDRQAQLVQKELACQRREEALLKREKQLEESLLRMQQEKIVAVEAAQRKAHEVDPKQEALDKALLSADDYRQQLRHLHKELSARELEVDALAQELAAEREKVAAQKLELETRAAHLVAEEDDMNLDFKRHAERIQASSRLIGDRTREIERKEKELERIKFEWDLKEADLKRRFNDVLTREAIVEGKAKDVQRVLDNSRSLELHAVQTQRISERLRAREDALWATAAKVVPHGARAVAAIREDLRAHHQKLEDLGGQLPSVLKASAV
jgi:hypothetical protein